jgi:hypothetical protein
MTCLQKFVRHRRLMALCAISAAVHLLAIDLLARSAPRARRPAPQLSVRLAATTQAASERSAPQSPSSATEAPMPIARPGHTLPATAAASVSGAADPATNAQDANGVSNAFAAATQVQTWDIVADGGDSARSHTPGFQSVQPPPSALLSYSVQRSAPGQPDADAGQARVDWHVDESGYSLSMQGVMGELESRGQMSDSGFVPIEATGISGGSTSLAAFDWAAARVIFGGTGAGAPITSDGQDRASMLMRLAGLGLAGAAQLNGAVELLVAGSDGVTVVRFQRVGEEDIESVLGKLATVHLAQVAPPGRPRLDVWLAPAHSWYPVQLRVTTPNGTVSTQTITSITPR